jgi:hypothetical protein
VCALLVWVTLGLLARSSSQVQMCSALGSESSTSTSKGIAVFTVVFTTLADIDQLEGFKNEWGSKW